MSSRYSTCSKLFCFLYLLTEYRSKKKCMCQYLKQFKYWHMHLKQWNLGLVWCSICCNGFTIFSLFSLLIYYRYWFSLYHWFCLKVQNKSTIESSYFYLYLLVLNASKWELKAQEYLLYFFLTLFFALILWFR